MGIWVPTLGSETCQVPDSHLAAQTVGHVEAEKAGDPFGESWEHRGLNGDQV